MQNNIFTLKIGGQAGQGQQAAGLIFAKACTRGGYYTFDYSEYPSLIRGGHVSFAVSVAARPISAIYETVNLLIALNKETIDKHYKYLSKDGVIVYDSDKIQKKDINGIKHVLYGLPTQTLLKENNLQPLVSNIIAIGASCGLMQYNQGVLHEAIKHIFEKKGQETIDMNIKAAKVGYDYAKKNFHPEKYHYHLTEKKISDGKLILTCNEALALGAVAAGCRLYVAYPMTPSTSILHALANWSKKTGMLVYQPEDEIAAAHVMIGAMYAGTRSMLATSGGGFALMAESLALSAMTETPAVYCVCSRPGPATGLPTWTEQGDLKFLVNCSHGDFPRVVLTPADPQEAFTFTTLAFNVAEKYQIATFILMDKYVSESQQTIDTLDTHSTIERGKILTEDDIKKMKSEYKRYAMARDGVSPRALPGTDEGIYLANSDEHDEYGYAIEGWNEPMRKLQVEKRAKKIIGAMKELPKPKIYGPKKAKLTLLGWGSTRGPILEALYNLPNVNYIHVPCPWPIDGKVYEKIMKGVKRLVTIENNFSGQFATILRGQTGITPDKQLLKYDGRQFWPEEIVEKAGKLL